MPPAPAGFRSPVEVLPGWAWATIGVGYEVAARFGMWLRVWFATQVLQSDLRNLTHASAVLGVHVLSSSEPVIGQLLLGAPTSPPPSTPPPDTCASACRSQTCASFFGAFTCQVSESSAACVSKHVRE